MKIANQCVVAIHYTLTDEQGQELDSSRNAEPLTYLHGMQGLIPGLTRTGSHWSSLHISCCEKMCCGPYPK